jgi:hypothetical protein
MWLAAPSSESSRVVPLGFSYAQLSEGERRERLDDARRLHRPRDDAALTLGGELQ